MKKSALFLSLALGVFFVNPAFAGPGKTYPISGTAVEVDSQYVVVEGEGKKLQMDRTGMTQITGELKTGDKVQVEYVLLAKDIKVTSVPKPEPAKEPVKLEAPKTETPKTEPAKVEPVKPALAPKVETKPSETKVEVKPAEPTKVEPVKALEEKVEAPKVVKEKAEEAGEKAGGMLDSFFKK